MEIKAVVVVVAVVEKKKKKKLEAGTFFLDIVRKREERWLIITAAAVKATGETLKIWRAQQTRGEEEFIIFSSRLFLYIFSKSRVSRHSFKKKKESRERVTFIDGTRGVHFEQVTKKKSWK